MSAVIHRQSPIKMFTSPWHHRELLWQLTKREVIGRYRGSTLGLLWSFFYPLLMLSVYTFVFTTFFAARWQERTDQPTDYALMLFAGMIVHGIFAECITRSPGLIASNANLVKKVVFPLELLPLVIVGSALFHAFVSTGILVLAIFVLKGHVLPTAIWVLPVFVPVALFGAAIGWLLSSLGVYLRDISQLAGIAATVLLFLSPVLYPASALSGRYAKIMAWNPLTPSIELLRGAIIRGQAFLLSEWVVLTLVSMVAAALCFAWFQHVRKGFADVV